MRFARIEEVTNADVVITELGTIGDIESQPFVEAIRQFRRAWRKQRCYYSRKCVHILQPLMRLRLSCSAVKSFAPLVFNRTLSSAVLRHSVDESFAKIANFCDVDADCVFRNNDLRCVTTFQHTWQHRDLIRV